MDKKPSIMVVDDERIVRESLFHWFKKAGHRVDSAASGLEALSKLETTPYDVLFVDIKMPGMNGIELLGQVRADYADTVVIIITAYGSIQSAIQAMKLGASDYLLKPFKPEYLDLVMEKISNQRRLASECRYLKGRLERISRFDNIIGQSPAMAEIFALIPEVAGTDASILLTGETGTGKELVAKAIHAKSLRADRPFIALNCGAIPDSLIESELFGHRKGAFTGALHTRRGFLEVVAGGTLFLDEIGEISPKMQVDLLRVLEDKQIIRVGGREPVGVDFRLIAATRRDLEAAVSNGSFREDFYYRINVIQIPMPPLRLRKEDIPLLAVHFLEKYSQETTKRVDRLARSAIDLLKNYNWPGNVRELQNAIERAVVLSRSRSLSAEDFAFLAISPMSPSSSNSLKDVEKAHIRQVLDSCAWNITQAAAILDIHRVTLHKKIKRYALR